MEKIARSQIRAAIKCNLGEKQFLNRIMRAAVFDYDNTRSGVPHEVASKKPNPWGLYDVHGNVWERVSDFYTKEPDGGIDPKGARHANYYSVLRGGSSDSESHSLRSAVRGFFPYGEKRGDIGFRLVRTPKQQNAEDPSTSPTGH